MASLTVIGLLAGVVGDGGWDTVSWLAMGIPVGVCIGFGWLRPGSSPAPGRPHKPDISETGCEPVPTNANNLSSESGPSR